MSKYETLSVERKALQAAGFLPEWMSSAGYQLYMEKYNWHEGGYQGQISWIAYTLAQHLPEAVRDSYNTKFYELLWNGWLSQSTPVLANTGTKRGLPVSCAGQYVEDSIDGFYSARRETALLTKHGFGTSAYLGDIRPRGSEISVGGSASGILPVLKGFAQDSRDVSQAGIRRGSFAGYIDIDHGDFDEVLNFLEREPDDINIGWNVSNAFLSSLEAGSKDSLRRLRAALRVKMITGKGYFFFPDKANAHLPEYYPIPVKASNLCSEIILPADKDHTFTCVLSSMNLAKYDEWKDTDAIFTATVFLDCVASEFISRAAGIPGLEKAVRFTEKARALGLGVCGFATLLQQRSLSMESLEAHLLNIEIFKELDSQSLEASEWLGELLGSPDWIRQKDPVGRQPLRNASRIAIAPTKSTALIMGGISEGINPDPAMVYTQATAGGEVSRVNPVLLNIMKDRGVYNPKVISDIEDNQGSVQHVLWLTDHEKAVLRTAFEIDQRAILRLATTRAKFIDQWQSLNLFFSADEDPRYIAEIHREAFLDPAILALYYCYSKSNVRARRDECESCM